MMARLGTGLGVAHLVSNVIPQAETSVCKGQTLDNTLAENELNLCHGWTEFSLGHTLLLGAGHAYGHPNSAASWRVTLKSLFLCPEETAVPKEAAPFLPVLLEGG